MANKKLEEILQEMTSGKLLLSDYNEIQSIITKYNEMNLVSSASKDILEDEVEENEVGDKKDANASVTDSIQKDNSDGNSTEQLIEKIKNDDDYQKIGKEGYLSYLTSMTDPFKSVPKLDIEGIPLTRSEKTEPSFSMDELTATRQQSLMDNPYLIPDVSHYDSYTTKGKKQKFAFFENLAISALAKVDNTFKDTFKFKDSMGKIDWHSYKEKTVLVLSNVKDAVSDNKIVNALGRFIAKKYKSSSFGIATGKIADTLTVHLMSTEYNYSKQFKNTLSLIGYDVKELLSTENSSKLNLNEVSDNINNEFARTTGLVLKENGYESEVINRLSSPQKLEFVEKIVWPKLTSMMKEAVSLNKAINEVKVKNPYYKKIVNLSKNAGFSEKMTISLLLNNPEILKERGIKGIDKLLEHREEIAKMYAKNEELCSKSFIALQNIVKASTDINNLVSDLNDVQPGEKERLFLKMRETVIDSNKERNITFESLQSSINDTLKDQGFVKSLRDVNDSINKIRERAQNAETKNGVKLTS